MSSRPERRSNSLAVASSPIPFLFLLRNYDYLKSLTPTPSSSSPCAKMEQENIEKVLCLSCSGKMVGKSGFLDHQNTIHKGDKFECQKCRNRFRSRGEAQAHEEQCRNVFRR